MTEASETTVLLTKVELVNLQRRSLFFICSQFISSEHQHTPLHHHHSRTPPATPLPPPPPPLPPTPTPTPAPTKQQTPPLPNDMPSTHSTRVQGPAGPNRGKKQARNAGCDSPKANANRRQQRGQNAGRMSAAKRSGTQWLVDGESSTEAREEKTEAEEVDHVIPQQRLPDANGWHRKLHDTCPVPDSDSEDEVDATK